MTPAPMPPVPAEPSAPPAEANGPKKSPKDLVVGINSDMMQLAEMLGANQATQEEAKALGALVQQYQSIVESLGQPPGGAKPQGPQMPSGAGAPEAGGNPNARPM